MKPLLSHDDKWYFITTAKSMTRNYREERQTCMCSSFCLSAKIHLPLPCSVKTMAWRQKSWILIHPEACLFGIPMESCHPTPLWEVVILCQCCWQLCSMPSMPSMRGGGIFSIISGPHWRYIPTKTQMTGRGSPPGTAWDRLRWIYWKTLLPYRMAIYRPEP